MSATHASRYLIHGLFLAGSLFIATAHASIVINGTRVIYPSDQKEVTLQLNNVGDAPLLVQSWIDDGNSQSTPDVSSAPFVVTPPISRVDGNQGQTLRVRYTGQRKLPQDKESLFWLNVLEVAPSTDDIENKLQISFRSRVKLFYRPSGLDIQQEEAAAKMQWRVIKKSEAVFLEGLNPSPYYLTIRAAKIKDVNVELNLETSLFAPGERKLLKLNSAPASIKNRHVEFSIVNDYGAVEKLKTPLSE